VVDSQPPLCSIALSLPHQCAGGDVLKILHSAAAKGGMVGRKLKVRSVMHCIDMMPELFQDEMCHLQHEDGLPKKCFPRH
jgi:hypothetical protein